MSNPSKGKIITLTGTVGAVTPIVALSLPSDFYLSVSYLRVICPSATDFLAVTYDNVTAPVVNGAGYTIAPLSSDEKAAFPPAGGAVQLLGSATGTPYTIEYSVNALYQASPGS